MRVFHKGQRHRGTEVGLRYRRVTAVGLCMKGLAIAVDGPRVEFAPRKGENAALVVSFSCQEATTRSIGKS
jgi:hypothetical protein